MRVTTAFKRLLRLPGASVVDVSFGVEGVIVTVRLRRRRRVCSSCGQTGRHLQIHDRRVKRWRHLDLGASRCMIECELRRLRCRDCGVRLEPVPWARPGAPHTRDFEDVVAWLAQQMAFAPITRLLRVGWHTIGPIVARVVADHLDEHRLAGLVCDRRRRDLLSPPSPLPDHRRRPRHGRDRVVRAGPQQRHLAGLLRRARRPQGLDPGGLDRHERRVPARDPRRRSRTPRSALTRSTSSASAPARPTRSAATNGTATTAPTPRPAAGSRAPAGRCSRRPSTRPSASSPRSPKSSPPTAASTAPSCCAKSCGCSTTCPTPRSRPTHLDAWLAWAARSRLRPFVRLARTLREHRDGILAAIRLGLSNGRLEGLNSKIRLISHRAFGFHSPDPLIALVYLCCAGITIELPR